LAKKSSMGGITGLVMIKRKGGINFREMKTGSQGETGRPLERGIKIMLWGEYGKAWLLKGK